MSTISRSGHLPATLPDETEERIRIARPSTASSRPKGQPPAMIGLLLVIGLLVSGAADAQDAPAPASPLNRLKLEFDIDRAELTKPLKELDGLYREQLERLRLDAQSRGRLEEVIAVQAELAALEGGGFDERGEDFPDLTKARSIYGKARGEREAAMRQGLLLLIERQREQLLALRTAQTQENRLEEAVRTDQALSDLLALEERTIQRRDAPGPGAGAGPRARRLEVRVQVDGRSHLHITGDAIWFDHTRGVAAPPGRHQGEFPTYLDGRTEWHPVWTGKVTERHPVSLDLSFAETRSDVRLRQSSGRGFAQIVQQPDPSNDHTLVVELRDETPEGRGFGGSDWMEFRLSW